MSAEYIELDEVLAIHDFMIEKFGGSRGVRDIGLVESALARPYAGFGDYEAYPDIFLKAAVLGFSLLKNHPFLDGNKRTAITAMEQFLFKNGFEIVAHTGEIYTLALEIEDNSLPEDAIAMWLKEHTHRVE